MNRDMQQQAEQLNKKHLLRQRWYRWLFVPASIVVLVTAYALILPAITLDTAPDTYCGQVEHIHTDECYETPGVPEHIVIDCAVQEETQVIHHHDSFCFDNSGELICMLPEVSATDAPEGVVHQHTAECQTTIPAVMPEGLFCEKTEHVHTAECLNPDRGEKTDTNETEQNTGLTPLTEMTGVELASMTDEEIAARTAEFLALTDTEFDALNERMTQAAGELPLQVESASSESTPSMLNSEDEMMLLGLADADTAADEPAVLTDGTAAQMTAVDLNGALTVTDDISGSDCYVASYGGTLSENMTFKWYRTDNGGTESAVARKYYRVGDEITSNISGDSFEKLNLALDGGGITNSRSSVTYRVVLCVDGVEQDIEASITNTTRQSEVLNGSLETPVATTGFQPFIESGEDGIVWKTSASDGKIELVSVANSSYKSLAEEWHGITSVPDGTQCAELNAEQAGALYQQVITTPGLTMSWQVSHMARTRSGDKRYNGTDAMYVVIMDAKKAHALAGDTTQILKVAKAIASGQYTVDGVDYSGAYSQLCESVSEWTSTTSGWGPHRKTTWTNSCDWQTHSGTYTIPAGQYNTTYFFVAASTASDDPTIGNHIDNVWFSSAAAPPTPNDATLTISKNLYGEMDETALNELRMNLKFNLVDADGTVLRTIHAYELGEWSQTSSERWELSKTISINDLVGQHIRIEEADYELEGYEVQAEAMTDTEFTVKAQQDYSASFKNTYTIPECILTLIKYVNAADRSGTFDITVTYPDSSGQTLTQTLTLGDGASGKIAHIPKNATVTVNEPDHDGYNVRFADSDGMVLSDSDYYCFAIAGDTKIYIYNTAGVPLPATGGVTPYLFIYGGLALMLSAVTAGYILRRRWGKEGSG